jgi:hypothetical protein
MKKFFAYILIIFTLAGIFHIARAQTPTPGATQMGDCVVPSSTGGPAQDLGQMTQADCNTISSGSGMSTLWTTPYNLLAPLPCPSGSTNPGCTSNGTNTTLTTFDPSDPAALANYLNLMIKIFIGICAVLAVVMIVLGGMEYMASELISSKEAGRDKITHAIFGLLLALGAWLLLNTINPDILSGNNVALNTNGIPAAQLNVAASDVDNPNIPNGTPPPPGSPSGSCTQGVVTTQSGLIACASIANNVNNLTAAATAAGLNISGSGYRSDAQQVALRIQNCNGDTTNASAVCNPPTALPGQSLHEAGEAFDLTCNGAQITTSSPCYPWLQANASKYGLINLPGEPWHWSINGH